MRGSLNKPRNKKAALQGLDNTPTKKAREVEGPCFSEDQTTFGHGDQQDNADTNAIFFLGAPSLEKTKSTSTKQSFGRPKLKPLRGSLKSKETQLSKKGCENGNTNMDEMSLANMLSLEKAKSISTQQSYERPKLKPLRGSFKGKETRLSKDDGEKGNTNMNAMSISNMLRFLESEETLITQLQTKMSAELARLQVEEHVFLQTLKNLGQKHALSNKVQDQKETSSGDQDFIDALNEALMENESVPSNGDKGEGTSEENLREE